MSTTEISERWIRTWMVTEKDEDVQAIVSEISGGRMSLVSLVRGLGEYLTADEEEQRQRGVELLSLTLLKLPPGKINKQSTRVLTTFYCDKLQDSGTIIPALKGIQSLVKLQTCSSLEVQSILRSMFLHVKTRALVQSVRFIVFSILDSLVANHRDVLKAMGKEFIDGYVSLAEGEKDPRNLIVAFAIVRVILIEFDISGHVETLFNITFCYFPITFRPPPNDPYGITTEDLRMALRGCLSATPYFGRLAVPLFLEKLLAGSKATKRDALQTISVCLPVYGPALARAEARKLWNSLKLEIFQPIDSATEAEALRTTQILVKTIHERDLPHEDNEDVQDFAQDVCEECIGILKEPEKSQARPAVKILCAFMSTTPSVAMYTISQVVPHLVKLFSSPDEAGNRGPILTALSEFIAAAKDSSSRLPDQPTQTEDDTEIQPTAPPFIPYKDEVLGVLTVGLKSTPSRRPALIGLHAMVITENLLTDEELAFVVHNVNDILEADSDELDDASDAVIDLLSAVANVNPRPVEEQTLPLLFSSLPDDPPPRDAIPERVKILNVLSALEMLCVQAQLFETLVVRLTTKLDLVCTPKPDSVPAGEGAVELHAAYAHWLLSTLAKTLEKKVAKGDPDVVKYIERLVPRIFNLFIFAAFAASQGEASAELGKERWERRVGVATNQRLVKKAGEIVTLVVQVLPLAKQESYASALYGALLEGKVALIADGHQKIPSDQSLLIFSDGVSTVQRNLLALFTSAIIALRQEVRPVVSELNAFLDKVLWWSIMDATTEFQRDAALHLLASVLNKRVDIEGLDAFSNSVLSLFWDKEINDPSVAPERRRNAIQAWIWISKALLVRNHNLASRFADKLFEAFEDEAVGWDAAKALGEVVGIDGVLTKSHHAVIRILYAQKFVGRVLPRIISGAKDASKPQNQTASLVALTSLIKSVPKVTYQHELPGLLPLLLRGLDLPDTNIRSNVIDTFLAAAEGDSPENSLVASHAPTLVNLMLKNGRVAEMPSPKVRISALKYLERMPSIVRYDVLHPSKPTVVKELGKVLDDPKRAVRRAAVDARTAWFRYHGSYNT